MNTRRRYDLEAQFEVLSEGNYVCQTRTVGHFEQMIETGNFGMRASWRDMDTGEYFDGVEMPR